MEPVARTITERVEVGVDTAPRLGLDAICAALGLDPFAGSLQIVDARQALALEAAADGEALQARWVGPSIRLLDAQVPLIVALRAGPTDSSLRPRMVDWLATRYPATHPVALVGSGTDGPETMALSLGEVASLPDDARYDALYLPPLDPLDDLRAPNTLGYITARLRAPGGCPWDREQTPASLTPYMIEEAHEAVDAIERGDAVDTVEELGDVLLQVVLHSQLAEEEGRFTLADIAAEVNAKLVRRHPHVFGDVSVSNSSEVLRNWESIKRVEKGEKRTSVLDGVPLALPALLLAQTIGRKAAKVGFDWPDVAGTLDKVREEIDEIAAAVSEEERREEVGDLLFALTSVCRHLGVDAEQSLRAATRKFETRFRHVETLARARGLDLSALDIDALEALWQEAKAFSQDA
jgi:tetrapyrrole methylase family protein/MazG family protein